MANNGELSMHEIFPGKSVAITEYNGRKYLSIRHIIQIVCEKNDNDAAQKWRRMTDERKAKLDWAEVPFRNKYGRSDTKPGITLHGSVKLIRFLDDVKAEEYMEQFAKIVVGYIGGDASMIREMMENAKSDAPLAVMAREEMAQGAPAIEQVIDAEVVEFDERAAEKAKTKKRKEMESEYNMVVYESAARFYIVKVRCTGNMNCCNLESSTEIEIIKRKSQVLAAREDITELEHRVVTKEFNVKDLELTNNGKLMNKKIAIEEDANERTLKMQKDKEQAALDTQKAKDQAAFDARKAALDMERAEFELQKAKDQAALDVLKARNQLELEAQNAKNQLELEAQKAKNLLELETRKAKIQLELESQKAKDQAVQVMRVPNESHPLTVRDIISKHRIAVNKEASYDVRVAVFNSYRTMYPGNPVPPKIQNSYHYPKSFEVHMVTTIRSVLEKLRKN